MVSTVELAVGPIDPPPDLRPREPFQHPGAVQSPLPVLKVDRAALTFAA